ncbi:uncharacterized protein BX663DRAFT_521615 [Cokeromyces recurvatus]|uniref:uncharacterized protein n=1 Tax=Cokeromyces recurvatus TaxID=90255 RepID=UPI00221F479D|nr:uncharacterized protein BX663DRAFT_521615 [Cokeromyces recurvatus]KAI7899400.1 hypothetical protein BX663DRAFT_521615 [Cokeromyces recurvatus]
MTHLSDFSYLERCAIWTYISVFLGYSIYIGDRFRCLRLRSIISGELKSIISVLLILMMLMQFMWDIVSTYVKYDEGFIVYEGTIITKPFIKWSSTHQRNMMAMDYVECVTFSLQVGVFFLMQSFWNYLSNTVAKKSFMSSFEFKFYIVWALGSMALFPILQWIFRDDIYKREGIPQLAYGIEILLAALLGIRSHLRFKRMIALSQRSNSVSNKPVASRLGYFKDMNLQISIILFSYGSSFIILCSDGLTESKIINSNKFATDTIITNVNICTVLLWLLLIAIFHPRPQYTRNMMDTSINTINESSYRYSNTPRSQITSNKYNINESSPGITGNTLTDNKYTMSSNNINDNNGGFMRAMSPVTVNIPYSPTNDTMPLTSYSNMGNVSLSPPNVAKKMAYKQQSHSLAVEDPYSNQPVMFSMMDIATVKGQSKPLSKSNNNTVTYPRQEHFPIYEVNNDIHAKSSQNNTYMDDHLNYVQTTNITASRPSWEYTINQVAPSSNFTRQSDDQMVREWLSQSPDRRNT